MNNVGTPTAEGSWTVLVYMAADNELAASAEKSLKNIKMGGSSSSVRTAVQIDLKGRAGATRYIGENGSFREELKIGEIDTGNPQPLIEFLKWGMARCPANNYAWVLWGHGAGVDQRTPGFTPGGSGECLGVSPVDAVSANHDGGWEELYDEGILEILHDYTTMHYLSNGCLRFALKEAKESTGRFADILGLDACLMGMTEIVCDCSDSALFAVTSEDTEPRGSWPYKEIISELVGNPNIDPTGLGTLIVKNYMASFPPAERRRGLTLSLCDLRKTPNLVEAVRGLSDALYDFLNAGGRPAIEDARNAAPRYDRDYVDLEGFCQHLAGDHANESVAKSCQAVISAIKNGFVVYSESEGQGVSRSDGLSIFFPTNERTRTGKKVGVRSSSKSPRSGNRGARPPKAVVLIKSSYKTLTFVRETRWDRFLLSYLDQNGNHSDKHLNHGGTMGADETVDKKGRKKPSGPRKKPSGPRKKPSGPRKKPSGPRKKPHRPKKKA